MRNFFKNNKTNILLFIGALTIYVLVVVANTLAEEYPIIDNMPVSSHVIDDVHNFMFAPANAAMPPEWLARIAIHEMRINQILYRDAIVRRLLEKDELQIFFPLYEEMLGFLQLALTQRHLIAEADITNLIDSTISLQEFLLLETFRQNINGETVSELQSGFFHWALALMGVQIGLIIALVYAVVWGR
jgi:hypothetical protein